MIKFYHEHTISKINLKGDSVIIAEIDMQSLQLCNNIRKATKTFLNSCGKDECELIVLQSFNPQIIKSILLDRLSHYDVVVKDYEIIPLHQLTNADLQKNQLSIITTKYKESIENLRYLNRDILVINFVYGNLIDRTDFYIDLMVQNISNCSRFNTNVEVNYE